MILQLNKLLDHLLHQRNQRKTAKLVAFCNHHFIHQNHLNVLDLGCGNGMFAQSLSTCSEIDQVIGVDVIDYRKTDIPFYFYEQGSHIPFPADTFDLTFIVEVLHHTDNAIHLLNEAKRVTRNSIVIFEDIATSKTRLRFMEIFDILMNMRHGVHTPLNFKTESEWLAIFKQLSFSLEKILAYNFYSIYTPQICKAFWLRV